MFEQTAKYLLFVVMLISVNALAQNMNKQLDIAELQAQAEQGDKHEQYNLAFRYEIGIDVEKSTKKALHWYTKAAEQGVAAAQFSLGYLYDEGIGVKTDYKKAHQWYAKANAQGSAEAKYAIGYLYYEGKGVKQSYRAAKRWFGEACDAGQSEGCEQYRHLNAIGI